MYIRIIVYYNNAYIWVFDGFFMKRLTNKLIAEIDGQGTVENPIKKIEVLPRRGVLNEFYGGKFNKSIPFSHSICYTLTCGDGKTRKGAKEIYFFGDSRMALTCEELKAHYGSKGIDITVLPTKSDVEEMNVDLSILAEEAYLTPIF